MSGPLPACLADLASADAAVAPALRERGAGGRLPGEAAHASGTSAGAEGREAVPLTSLPRHAGGVVAGVRLPAGASASDPALERMALRLIEIGFVQGTSLRVIAFGQPGDDPIGVRIGGRGGVSTFALRRLEAACVWVWRDAR